MEVNELEFGWLFEDMMVSGNSNNSNCSNSNSGGGASCFDLAAASVMQPMIF
jgi:hypothetical protein